MSSRNIMTILQWLPLEDEDDRNLFLECKDIKSTCNRLCLNLSIFLKTFNSIKPSSVYYNANVHQNKLLTQNLEDITVSTDVLAKRFTCTIGKLSTTDYTGTMTRIKVRFWKEALWKSKLKLIYFLQQLINQIAYLYIHYGETMLDLTLRLATMYNRCLSIDLKYALHRNKQVSSNMCPYLLYPLRKISITSLLQVLAENRAELCCHKLIDCLLDNYKFFDTHNDDDSSENSSMEIYRAITNHMSPPMNVVVVDNDSPKYERTEFDEAGSFVNMEELISYEEQNVIDLLNCALNVAPAMLGTDGVRKTKSGETKVNPRIKSRVLDYYQEILWGEVGNYLEHIILWWGSSPLAARLPHSSQHLREWINQFIPRADIPPYISSALVCLADALGVHVTSTSWDQHFRLALVASKNKYNTADTGRYFYEMLHDLVNLCNQCEITIDWLSGAPLDELPLVEQIPVLHRLDHSVHTTRLWATMETKRLANHWRVDEFFLIAHTDVAHCLNQLNALRLIDHADEIARGGLGVHVHVCANMREKLASEVRVNIQKLKECPKECVDCLANVCTTISLANLQMIFPLPNYWRREFYDGPVKASNYVARYLDEVLTPVLSATDDHVIINMILKLMCEALLDHIYINKIKFTQCGALQLLEDFASINNWINNECGAIVSDDLRKEMSRNEVLRRCEGVGKLLLRSPGEHIKMNGKNVKKKHDRNDSPRSEDNEIMPAEMYVPNQEQWLELRANKRRISCFMPICCGE